MKGLKLFACVFAITFCLIGCARLVSDAVSVTTSQGQKYDLKPEVRIQIEQSDRIELFAGGLHVGTIIFDPSGMAYFVGDADQVQGVIAELMNFINIITQSYESDKQGA